MVIASLLSGCVKVEEFHENELEAPAPTLYEQGNREVQKYLSPPLTDVCKDAGGRLVFGDDGEVVCVK